MTRISRNKVKDQSQTEQSGGLRSVRVKWRTRVRRSKVEDQGQEK